MRISLDNLLVLDAIERNGSFALAAEELNRVPSAITYAINQLESALGIVLFDRSGYRAKLTPAGLELLREGRILLDQAMALEKKIKVSAGLAPMSLSLAYDGALDFQCIGTVLGEFFESYPEISVYTTSEILNGCKDALITGSADLVVGCFNELPTEGHYSYEELGQIEFVFAVAPNHPLVKSAEPLTHKAIAAHRIVVVPDTAKTIPVSSSGYASNRHYLSVPSVRDKIEAQVAGLGVGFLPMALAQPYLEKGLLIKKQVDRPKASGKCYLAWRADRVSYVLESAINLFRKHKKELL